MTNGKRQMIYGKSEPVPHVESDHLTNSLLSLIGQLFNTKMHALQDYVCCAASRQNLLKPVFGQVGTRDQYFIDFLFSTNPLEIIALTQHFEAMNYLAGLSRIIVEKTNRRILPVAIIPNLAQEQLTAIAGAVNQHSTPAAVLRHRQDLSEEAESEPTSPQQQQQKQTVQREYGSRVSLKSKRKQKDEDAEN